MYRSVYTVFEDPGGSGAPPGAFLELFIKETSPGEGYAAHFVYGDSRLPVTVTGILLRGNEGLQIGELELFRTQWGYFDDYGEFVGEDGSWHGKDDGAWDVSARSELSDRAPFRGISGALLRAVPIGRILAWAQSGLTDQSWREEGIVVIGADGNGTLTAEDLPSDTVSALERAQGGAGRRRGRPPLSDDLMRQFALVYLEEAPRGRGLTRRMAARFDRPEQTVRDWVHIARERHFLSHATPGRAGAAPGDRLLEIYDTKGEDE